MLLTSSGALSGAGPSPLAAASCLSIRLLYSMSFKLQMRHTRVSYNTVCFAAGTEEYAKGDILGCDRILVV